MDEVTTPTTINLDRPYRSRIYRLLNSIKSPKEVQVKDLRHSESLDPETRRNGEFLLQCIYASANMNAYGHWMIENYYKEVLRNHYQISQRLNGEPLSPIKDPVFILGLPRTGSTFLFNLLGATGRFRTLRNWESHRVASRRPVFLKKMEAKFILHMQHRFAPGLKTIHEQRLEGPEECTKLLMISFVSQLFPGLFHIPEYNEFLETADYLPTYDLYYKQLQILGDHGKRWLSKAPIHIQSIDSLLKVFPDAKIIHLDREFEEVLGSACSLAAGFRGLTCDKVNGRDIGREVRKLMTRDVARSQEVLDGERERVLRIHYRRFLDDPIRTVKAIFEFSGCEYSEASEIRVKEEMEISVPNKFGKHVYRLEDYFETEAEGTHPASR